MSAKLTPPQQVDFKGTISVDPSKYSRRGPGKSFSSGRVADQF